MQPQWLRRVRPLAGAAGAAYDVTLCGIPGRPEIRFLFPKFPGMKNSPGMHSLFLMVMLIEIASVFCHSVSQEAVDMR